MSKVSTPHRTWCAESDCYTRQDGQAVHVSTEASFIPDRGHLTVRLADVGDGIEVGIGVDTPIFTTSVRLIPEIAIELAESLIEHARRAGARYDHLAT